MAGSKEFHLVASRVELLVAATGGMLAKRKVVMMAMKTAPVLLETQTIRKLQTSRLKINKTVFSFDQRRLLSNQSRGKIINDIPINQSGKITYAVHNFCGKVFQLS